MQTKVQDQMASLGNPTTNTKKNSYQSFSNSSERLKRRRHSQSHSMKPTSPWHQTRQRHYKKKKKERNLQANISEKYRCETPQQNICKLNPKTHKKDPILWSNWIHSTVTRMTLHTQISQWGAWHQQKTRQKPQGYVHRCRERMWNRQTLISMCLEGTYLNITKAIYNKPTAKHHCQWWKAENFPQEQGKDAHSCHFYST